MTKRLKCSFCVTSRAWKTRNNSANVAAILHPGYDCNESDDEIDTSYVPHRNNCYCRDKPIKPKLFSKPKSCGKCYEYVPSPASSRVTSSGIKLSHTSKSPTKSRHKSHRNRSDPGPPSPRLMFKYRNKETNTENGILPMERQKTKKDDDATAETLESDKSSKNLLKNLNDFRNDHYFETHSVENLVKPIPDHTCVHRFELDDRFLPKPLNADAYGLSRCIICGKSMKNPENTGAVDDKTPSKGSGIFPKFYKYGLAPRQVYIGNGDVKIQMVVPDQNKHQMHDAFTELRPSYFNTYALRYQRGVK